MSRISQIGAEFVESFPDQMAPGVLYISTEFNTCGHLCCCGCEEEVVTPLSPAQWSFSYDGQTISLAPSVGNWSLPCESHYWIRNSRVHWSRHYTPHEIKKNRRDDQRALQQEQAVLRRSFARRLWNWLSSRIENA